jgi:hypothetical protein
MEMPFGISSGVESEIALEKREGTAQQMRFAQTNWLGDLNSVPVSMM